MKITKKIISMFLIFTVSFIIISASEEKSYGKASEDESYGQNPATIQEQLPEESQQQKLSWAQERNQGNYSEKNPIGIFIDGKEKKLESAPVLAGDTVFVPLRGIFEELGAKVEWNQEFREITVKREDVTIRMQIGSSNAFIDNKLYTMHKNPFLNEDNTAMVPLRFIGEALHCKISWDQKKKQVDLITSEGKGIVTSITTAAAATASGILTYEEAIQKGVKNSDDYNSAVINAERATSYNDDMPVSTSYSLMDIQAKQTAKLNEKWSEMQLSITADRVGNDIRNGMDNLSMKMEEVKALENKLSFLEYKLKMETLKYESGILSKNDLENAKLNQKTEQLNLEDLNIQIEGEFIDLNAKLGLTPGAVYPFEFHAEYSPIGEVDLERKCLDDTASDPYIWYAGQNLDDSEFKLITYEYNVVGGQSWALTDLDVSNARLNLAGTKSELNRVIRERYNGLIEIEKQISILEINLAQAKNTANMIGIQFVTGNATKMQVEEAQQTMAKLDLDMEKLKLKHGQAKMIFEKPYLAPEYFSTK